MRLEARQHNVSGREWNGISRMGMTRNMQPAIRFPLQRKNNASHRQSPAILQFTCRFRRY